MSREGTPRKAKRSELVKRLEALRLNPGDVILLRLPDADIQDPERLGEAQRFIQEIADMTKRGVAIVHEDLKIEGFQPPVQAPAPRLSRIERVRPVAVTRSQEQTLQTPGSKIVLPGFRKT